MTVAVIVCFVILVVMNGITFFHSMRTDSNLMGLADAVVKDIDDMHNRYNNFVQEVAKEFDDVVDALNEKMKEQHENNADTRKILIELIDDHNEKYKYLHEITGKILSNL